MAFKDYSLVPSDNTELGDGTYIGANMLRNKVRPALQQLAADGKELADEVEEAITGTSGSVAAAVAAAVAADSSATEAAASAATASSQATLAVTSAASAATSAESAATDAEAASAAASSVAAASRYFSSQAAGEAGSSTGQLFSYPDGSGNLVYAERTDGGSTIIALAASQARQTALEAKFIDTPTTLSMASYATLTALFDYLSTIRIGKALTIPLGAATYNEPGLLRLDHPDAAKIKITGTTSSVTITSFASKTSTVAYNHSLTVNVLAGHGMVAGQYLRIPTGSVTDRASRYVEGAFPIVSVTSTTITLRLFDARTVMPMPVSNAGNIAAVGLKSVVSWNSALSGGMEAIAAAGLTFEDVVFEGNYDPAVAPSDNLNNGLSIVTSYHVPGGNTSRSSASASAISLPGCAFVRWMGRAIYCAGSTASVEAGLTSVAGCGWRGYQATQGASIFCKGSALSGVRKAALHAEGGATLDANNCTVASSGEQGAYVIGDGLISITNGTFTGNDNGTDIEVKDGGTVGPEGSHLLSASQYHVKVTGKGSIVSVDSVTTANATVAAFGGSFKGAVMARGTAPTVAEATMWATDADYPGEFVCVGYFGPTITQLTSKATAVTLNARTGRIITHNSSLSAGGATAFTVSNNQLGARDTVRLSLATASSAMLIWVDSVVAGSFRVILWNTGGSPLSEALTLNMTIQSGADA